MTKTLDSFVVAALIVPLVAIGVFFIAVAMVAFFKKTKKTKTQHLCYVCIRLYVKPKQLALLVEPRLCTICGGDKIA